MHAMYSNESFCNVTMEYQGGSIIKDPKYHNLKFASEYTPE
jgi:hypothetical protein